MAEDRKLISYHSIVTFGVCPKCNHIYKSRIKKEPEDGIHRCRNCDAEVPIIRPDKKPTVFDD